MKTEDRRRNTEVRRLRIFLFCLLSSVFCLPACSIPNLESPECVESRIAVREFYSFHFGNEMKPSAENLKLREKFLSQNLRKMLFASGGTTKDYFTTTDDYPKTFRVGECKTIAPDKTVFEIVLFWKDDGRNDQREIKVEAVKENGIWLIDKVSDTK